MAKPTVSADAPDTERRGALQPFASPRRARLFLASVGFLITFALVRGMTHAIRAGLGLFHDVQNGSFHLHHLVFGILLLLAVSYLWLLQIGTDGSGSARWLSYSTALLYGVAAALTLDEFALWLRLEDVYWDREGRESIDAVVLFGALLSVGWWGGVFQAIGYRIRQSWRRGPK